MERGFRLVGAPMHNVRIMLNGHLVAEYENWKELQKNKEITLPDERVLKIPNKTIVNLDGVGILGDLDPKEKLDQVGGYFIWLTIFGVITIVMSLSVPPEERSLEQSTVVRWMVFGLIGLGMKTHARIGIFAFALSAAYYIWQISVFFLNPQLTGVAYWFSIIIAVLFASFYWRGLSGGWELLRQGNRI